MKKIFLLSVLFWLYVPGAIANEVADHAIRLVEGRGLHVINKLKPVFLVENFHGDGRAGHVFFVQNKSNKKFGFCVLRRGSNACTVIGAGNEFGIVGDDFKWVDKWELVPKGETWETVFNSVGEVDTELGPKKVVLANVGFRVCASESGCGVIHFKNGRYHWVHQAD